LRKLTSNKNISDTNFEKVAAKALIEDKEEEKVAGKKRPRIEKKTKHKSKLGEQ